MPRSRLVWTAALAAALSGWSPLQAQSDPGDRPTPLPAAKLSKADRDRAEAATLFGLGSLHEGRHRLLEALRCYETACKLDPDAVAPRRALVPLYLALDRLDEALTTARRVLELDPDDWETGLLCARQLRAQSKPKESAEVLRRAAASSRLKEKPDAYAQLLADVAGLEEDIGEWPHATAALDKLTELLDHPAPLIEQEMLTAEEATSKSAEAYESLGRVWLKAGNPAKAVAAFEAARSRDPGRAARLALHLAEIHDRAGRPREALARLDDYLVGRPAGTEGYEMKIRLLNQLGQAERIVPALQTASQADRHNTALTLLLARELRKTGQLDAALQIYEQLIGEGAGPDVYRGLFGLYKEQKDGGRHALLLLDKTIKAANPPEDDNAPPKNQKPAGENSPRNQAPDLAQDPAANGRAMLVALREDPAAVQMLLNAARPALASPDKLHDSTRFLLAVLAERTRKLDIAEELYRSCLTRTSGRLQGGPQSVYLGLLMVLKLAHKYQAVIDLCKQGLAEAGNVNRTIFFYDMSVAQMALGQFDDALAAANQAVDVANPDARLGCQRQRAEVLSKMGRHTEAIAACQEMLREYNQPQKEDGQLAHDRQAVKVREVRLLLSLVYSAAREPEKSEEQLQLVLEADPDSPDNALPYNNLGFQWAERGVNLPEAERFIRKAIDLDHRSRSSGKSVGLDADLENAAYIDSLGWVLFRKGDFKGARAELEKAVTLPGGDDDPVVWDHLADVLFRLGEKEKAAADWRKALTLFETGARPKDDRYREIQQKLKQTAP
jgi:tetratricopeptide (TPR) repeat protein